MLCRNFVNAIWLSISGNICRTERMSFWVIYISAENWIYFICSSTSKLPKRDWMELRISLICMSHFNNFNLAVSTPTVSAEGDLQCFFYRAHSKIHYGCDILNYWLYYQLYFDTPFVYSFKSRYPYDKLP